jgi:1,4-alpha-glucan branching enzyme
MFADSVAVAGDFSGWAPTPMERDAPGCNYWSVDVPGAAVGQAYKFVLPYAVTPGRNAYRMDPYASSLKADGTGNVNAVVTGASVPYKGGAYSTPPWSEAVLYEMHIPTFNADPALPPDGTFDTAMVRLPELRQLGINAIEIMPLGQFPGNAGTGYNQATSLRSTPITGPGWSADIRQRDPLAEHCSDSRRRLQPRERS